MPGLSAAPSDGAGHVATRAAGQYPTTVLVVDDHPGFRLALESLLENAPDLELIGSACNGTEAVDLVKRLRPQVVVMDLSMPEPDGIAATRLICESMPAVPAIIALSGSRERWREARAAGASFTVLKDDEPQLLLDTVRAAAAC